MKPLREHVNDPDGTVRAGATLLSKLGPLELTAEQRRRIRARVDAAAAAEPRGQRWLRPALALPVLLAVGVAGASIGQGWFRPAPPQRQFEQEPSRQVVTERGVAPVKADPPVAPAPSAETAHEVPTIAPESSSLDKATPSATPKAAPSGPGAALMMEALQARRAGDTARAQQLTAEYQKRYPAGALREEALAISFESAAARKDPSAKRLAQKYLVSYPHGRFRKQAEQVVANQD